MRETGDGLCGHQGCVCKPVWEALAARKMERRSRVGRHWTRSRGVEKECAVEVADLVGLWDGKSCQSPCSFVVKSLSVHFHDEVATGQARGGWRWSSVDPPSSTGSLCNQNFHRTCLLHASQPNAGLRNVSLQNRHVGTAPVCTTLLKSPWV